MAKNDKLEPTEEVLDEEELVSRRDFLVGLGKWSKIVIGLALFGGTLAMPENDADARAFAWANGGGGGGWANRWGGGGWANRYGGGGWINGGGGGWANRGGGGWNNGGGGGIWGNRVGGGGWANRRGGGGWFNRR